MRMVTVSRGWAGARTSDGTCRTAGARSPGTGRDRPIGVTRSAGRAGAGGGGSGGRPGGRNVRGRPIRLRSQACRTRDRTRTAAGGEVSRKATENLLVQRAGGEEDPAGPDDPAQRALDDGAGIGLAAGRRRGVESPRLLSR